MREPLRQPVRHVPGGRAHRPATIADVAAAAGCSTAVVSRVLNGARGNIGCSPATRARVLDAAARLAYRPNHASRSLALRRTQTLGVYVPPAVGAGLGYPYESALLAGVEAACREAGYDILAVNLGGQQSPERCAHKLAERRIDGLILLHVLHDAPWVEPLCAAHDNVAAVNYYGACRALDVINFDDLAATALAVERLVALGHRRLGYLGVLHPFPGPGERLRRTGFCAAVQRLGLPDPAAWVLDDDHPARLGALEAPDAERPARLARWIAGQSSARRPTAWVVHNDAIAVPFVKALGRAGIAVPNGMSVVGIDDSEVCRFSEPELTSVRQPFFTMGHWAAGRVIARATAAAAIPCVQQLAAPEWVPRASTGEPARRRASASRSAVRPGSDRARG